MGRVKYANAERYKSANGTSNNRIFSNTISNTSSSTTSSTRTIPIIRARSRPSSTPFSSDVPSAILSSTGDARFVGKNREREKQRGKIPLPEPSFVRTKIVTVPGENNTVVDFSLPPWMDPRHIAPALFSETSKTNDLGSKLPQVKVQMSPTPSIQSPSGQGTLMNTRRNIEIGLLYSTVDSYVEDNGTSEENIDDVIDFLDPNNVSQCLEDVRTEEEGNNTGTDEESIESEREVFEIKPRRKSRKSIRRLSISSQILNSKTLERRLEEKLKRKLGFDGVKLLQSDDFVVPATDALQKTLRLAIDVQNSALRKNWHFVRDAFRHTGGIMSPKSLRYTLIREVHLTLMQAQRIEVVAREQLMGPGDRFILYEEFRDCFKLKQWRKRKDSVPAVESDGESEDELELALKKVILQTHDKDVVASGEHKIQMEKEARKLVNTRTVNKLRDQLSGRAHAQGEFHRDDARELLAGLGTSVKYLHLLRENMAPSLKTKRVREVAVKADGSVARAVMNLESVFEEGGEEVEKDEKKFPDENARNFSENSGKRISSADVKSSPPDNLLDHVLHIRYMAAATTQRCARSYLMHMRDLNTRSSEFRTKKLHKYHLTCAREWFDIHIERLAFYSGVRRPLHEWAKRTRNLQHRRLVFTRCFWPFRVWRREWAYSKSCRYKAGLLSQVWEAARLKRVIHHWRDMKNLANTQRTQAMVMNDQILTRLKRDVFVEWKDESEYQMYVKQKMMAHGNGMLVASPTLRKFQILRVLWYFAQTRRASRQSARNNYKHDVDSQFDALFGWHSLATSQPPRLMDALSSMTTRKLRSRHSIDDRLLELAEICLPIQQSFESNGSLMRRQIYFEFRTLMPRVISALRGYVTRMRRKRFVWKRYCALRKRKMWRLWRRYVFQRQLKRRDQLGVEQRLARPHSLPPGWPCGIGRRVHIVKRTTALVSAVKPHTPSRSDRPRFVPNSLELIAEESGGRVTGGQGTYGGGQQKMKVEKRSMQPSGGDVEMLSQEQRVVLLRRSRSLDEKTFELAVLEYNESLRLARRQAFGADVKERMERTAEKRRQRDQATREYAVQWHADLDEAEQRTFQANQDILAVQRGIVHDVAKYELHRQRMLITQNDQTETLQVGQNLLEEKKEDLKEKKQFALDHGLRLYNMRAQMLHDVLCKVIDEVDTATSQRNKLRCFNRFRIMLLEKRALDSAHKGMLKRWVDICTNLRRLDNSMPQYRRARFKRVTFTKWINYMGERYQFETPGLRHEVKRRGLLVNRFSQLVRQHIDASKRAANRSSITMQNRQGRNSTAGRNSIESRRQQQNTRLADRMKRTSKSGRDGRGQRNRSVTLSQNNDNNITAISNGSTGAVKEVHNDDATILIDASSRTVAYARWVEFVQFRRARKSIVKSFIIRSRLRLLQRCFVALHDTLRPQYTRHSRVDCFGVMRVNHDLEKWHIGYIKLEARLLTTWLRHYHGFVSSRVKRSARRTVTLKKIVTYQSRVVDARMHLERRLLFAAFETRGTFNFRDMKVDANLRDLIVRAPLDATQIMRAALQKKLEHLEKASSRPGSREAAARRGSVTVVQEGDDFDDDIPLPDGHTSIKEVVVHIADSYVQGIQLTYVDLKTSRRHGTQVHGNKHGQRQTFALRALAGEKLVGIEGVFGRYVTRLRFHTSTGRMSPWFGGGAHGSRFMLGVRTPRRKTSVGGSRSHRATLEGPTTTRHADTSTQEHNEQQENNELASNPASKSFVDKYIIGLHGVCTGTTILEMGVHMRSVVEKGVFVNCWTRYPGKAINLLPPDEAETQENREFAYLLRMRYADLLKVKDRAQALARRMYRNKSDRVAGLDSLFVVRGVSNWLFNSLSHGLLRLPPAHHQQLQHDEASMAAVSSETGGMEQGTLVDGGYDMVETGRQKLREAKEQLAQVPGYSTLGMQAVTETALGRTKARAMRKIIFEAEALAKEGEEEMIRGEALAAEGNLTLPRIPDRDTVRVYYERLVNLAGVKDSAEAIVNQEEEANAKDRMTGAENAAV